MAKLHFLKSVTDTINTSFILESNGTLLVVDGGFPSEASYLYEYLKGLGGHVDTWFLTHFHDDHFGAFLTILQEHPDIIIDKVCFNFPSDEFILKYEPKQSCKMSEEWIRIFNKSIKTRNLPVVTATEGDVYEYDNGNVTVRVLRTYDESLPYINDSSTVFRFEVDGKSILFLGDLAVKGGHQLLAKQIRLWSRPISYRWRITAKAAWTRSATRRSSPPIACGRRPPGCGTTWAPAATTPTFFRLSSCAVGSPRCAASRSIIS